MDSKASMKLRKLVKELEGIRGRHTELISVYVPSGFSLVEVISQLKDEQSTAVNIKSRTTRKNVLGALEKAINHLQTFKQTPPNGLIVFCGNVSEKEGEQDIRIWSIEPPEPMNVRLYRCDQTFLLDPLKEMVREREVYGLIVLDANDSDIGLLIGKKIILKKHLDSLVPGKTRKGGFSQQRYSRLREEAKVEHLKKTGEKADSIFGKEKDLKGIIVGGPGPLKEKFYEGDYLDYRLKEKLIGKVNTSYTGMAGLEEMIKRGEKLIEETSIMKEKVLLEEFFGHLQRDDGLAVYGLEEVERALNLGSVKTLLISEEFDWIKARLSCQCGNEVEVEIRGDKVEKKCPKCGGELEMESEEDLSELLEEKAKEMGSEVEFVSIDTREGVQFKELGGIGGILRFKVS